MYPESRFRHCHEVGRVMYDIAKKVYKMPEPECEKMYFLGMFHDLGYEFEDRVEHDENLSDALGFYEYAQEIKYHSKYQSEYESYAMKLLYYADSVVDGFGKRCTFEERLADLEKRHGITSESYLATKEIIEHLKEWGFDGPEYKKATYS